MRASGIRLIATVWAAFMTALLPCTAAATPACAGDACESLTLSDDGCVWKNVSDKPVKFTLFNATETLFATVLPPGDAFRQTAKAACITPSPESPRYQANFAAVRKMPDAPDFTLRTPATAAVPPAPRPFVPRAKPDASTVTTDVPVGEPVVAALRRAVRGGAVGEPVTAALRIDSHAVSAQTAAGEHGCALHTVREALGLVATERHVVLVVPIYQIAA